MTKKLLALLLAVLCLLTSCTAPVDAEIADTTHVTSSVGEGEIVTEETSIEESQSSVSVPAVTEPSLPAITDDAMVVVKGKTQYEIIIPDGAGADSAEVTLANNIDRQIQLLTTATAKVGTDWLRAGTEHDASSYEILLGNTNYPETAQVAANVGYGGYAVRAVGNKIVVFGYTEDALAAAVSAFQILLRDGADRSARSITLSKEVLDRTATVNPKLEALPRFTGGRFYAYYEAGADCDEIILRDVTLEQYQNYLSAVVASGYTQYTSHQMADNYFATFTNDRYTVTAGYYDYESSVRLLLEPLAPAVGLESENVYTPVTTSQITMLGASYTAAGTTLGNGLSVVIRLTDGRFVIVDGGHNYAGCARELVNTLRSQSAGYAGSDSEITVAAWIITHPHGDHHGVLNSNYALFRNMNVERVLVNYLSETERQAAVTSKAYGANWGTNEGKGDSTLAAAKALGATVHQVHVGQVFWLADLKMEVLYTIESYAPETCNALNTTSTVMRMEFGGKTVYLSTGDATGIGMEICADMYSEYLQSDIIQVCHHGYSTWGNDAGMIKAYRTVNAPTLLWPQGYNAYLSSRTKEYNHVLFTLSNFKEVLVSGAVGDQIIIPIPYTVGSAKVIRAGN